MSLLIVKTSLSDVDEAFGLSTDLVTKKLAACVQMSSPITSVYMWKGEMETELEFVLEIKTLLSKKAEIETYIEQNHSYETPELTYTTVETNENYLKWVKEELTPA